jgi:glycosyltransferase involved in cell wall biosynthesis
MKICLVHDWLTSYGGAELVLKTMLEIWPDAPIFTLVYDPEGPCKEIIQSTQVHGSFINKYRRAKRNHRTFLPVMPLAIEQFDLSEYDVVLSSSHAVAKGVITGPDQLHISYVHTPIRYAWDLQPQYLADAGLTRGLKSWLARALLHYIRIWDERTVAGVDHYIANSKFVAQRIWKFYKRNATIIHPPVEIDRFTKQSDKKDFYLTVSRLVPYKKIGLIVEAFRQMPDKKLVVIGDGPEMKAIRERQTSNIELLGFVDNETTASTIQDAKALIFAAEEDFGIVPVEAQACGTPVIAYGKGGALETVIEGETGYFFAEQTPESIVEAVKAFETKPPLDPEKIRQNAEHFAKERFKTVLKTFVDARYSEFRQTERPSH